MLYTDIKKFSKLLFFFYERKNKFVQRLIMTKGKAEQGSPINVNLKFFCWNALHFFLDMSKNGASLRSDIIG